MAEGQTIKAQAITKSASFFVRLSPLVHNTDQPARLKCVRYRYSGQFCLSTFARQLVWQHVSEFLIEHTMRLCRIRLQTAASSIRLRRTLRSQVSRMLECMRQSCWLLECAAANNIQVMATTSDDFRQRPTLCNYI